jgi:class 3 adenylate cyclase
LIAHKIAEHQGRIVKLMGDGILAEFPSVSAVSCAVEVQPSIRKRNAIRRRNAASQFRIGINLGDVIVEAKTFTATV